VKDSPNIENASIEVSDDQDPNNPFGDAAALDDQHSWPDEEQRGHVEQEAEKETAEPSLTAIDRQSEAGHVFEEDAWAEQDEINVTVDPFVANLNTAASASVPEISEEVGGSTDYNKDDAEVLPIMSSTSASSLKVGSIIHHVPVDQQEEVAENTWGWDEDEVGVHLEIQKETPPSMNEESMTSPKANTTEKASPQTNAATTVDPIDLLFEQLEDQSETTFQQASAVSSSLYDTSTTKTFDVDEFFKEFTDPPPVAAPAVAPSVAERTKEESATETSSQLSEEFSTEQSQQHYAQQETFGVSLESQIEEDFGADDAWGVDAPWSDLKEQTQETLVPEVASVDVTPLVQKDTLSPLPSPTIQEEHVALEESDLMTDNQSLHEHTARTSSVIGQDTLEELDFLQQPQHISMGRPTFGTGPISTSNVEIGVADLDADPWDAEDPITHKTATPEPQQIQETPLEEKISESAPGEADAWDEQIDIDIDNDVLEPMADVTSAELNAAPVHKEALDLDSQSEGEQGVAAEADPWDEPIEDFVESTEDREQGTGTDPWDEPIKVTEHEPSSTVDETAVGLEETQPGQAAPTLISATVEHQNVVSDEKEIAWGFDDGTQHHYEEVVETETFAPMVVDSTTASMSPHDRLFSDDIHHLPPSLASVVQFSPKATPASLSAKFAPSSPVFDVRRTDHEDDKHDARDDDEQDAWGDDGHVLEYFLPQQQGQEDVSAAVQEEVGEIHEAAADQPLAEVEKLPLEELPEVDTEALDNSWGFDMDEQEHTDVTPQPTVITVPSVTAALQDAGHRTPSPSVTGGLSPLTIRKDSLLVAPSGADSSESNDDNASQSPWQDISPASVSKRSEAGMSVGSEFDSEYSVRSLDEDERHMHAPAHTEHEAQQHHGFGSISKDDRKKDGMISAMSWTDLNHDDDWQDNTAAIDSALGGEQDEHQHHEEHVHHAKNISLESSSSKDIGSSSQSAGELVDLPDISGVDSWDFDHDEEDDIEVTKTTTSTLMSHTPTATRSSMFSRDNLKTPDMTRDIAGTSGLQHKSSFTGSSFTSVSPGGRTALSSYQSSLAGSVPPSPGNTLRQPTTTTAAGSNTDEVEVEDDSHLPLAIRQQRARLAAKGKPLPPISKYKSTKTESSSSFTETSREHVVTSPSPKLASATTSPVISFSSPITSNTTTASATGHILPIPDQKVLSPALQKQRERLEQKRATAAAAAAAKKLTAVEATKSTTLASLTSPTLVASTPFTSNAGSSLRSALPPDASDTSMASSALAAAPLASTLSSVSDLGQASSRRRGSGAIPGTSPSGVLNSNTNSSSGRIKAATPSSPLSEGFMRRSKDGHRPAGLWSQEHEDEQDSWDQGVVHTSQSDVFRHGVSNKKASRISTSSGWDHTLDEEDLKERQQQEDQPLAGLAKSPSSTVVSKPTTLFSPKAPLSSSTPILATSSSSSFYQQTVPGLDETEDEKKEGDKSNLFMKTSSDDKDSKILDSEAYDPYGPATSRQQLSPLKTNNRTQKAKSSFEEDRAGVSAEFSSHHHHHQHHQEVLMDSSISSPSGVSLMSPTLGGSFSMNHRHDHHRGHASGSHSSNNNSGGAPGSGSLMGDISSILKEKKTSMSGSDNNSSSQQFNDNDYKGKSVNPMTTSSSSHPTTSPAPSRPAPKASGGGWSFGSLLSSAVAVATETIDKAYESLDPEYGRMKTRGGGSTTFSDDGTDESQSTSPFKKPGYVVGGSSLALGLASITTTKSSPLAPASPPPMTPAQPSSFQSKQEQGRSKPSFDSFSRPGDSDPEPSEFQHQHQQHQQHHHISTSNTSVSPRMTRKHVDRRE